MRAKEAGPLSSTQDTSAKSPCTHSRMVEDELTADGLKSGRLVCTECRQILPDSTPSPPSD